MENLMWVLVGLVAVVASVSIILSVLFGERYAGGTYGPFGMMGYGFYGMGFIMPIIGVLSVVFVLIFIFFILDASRGTERSEPQMHYRQTAEEVARMRLASGEISEEEFNSIMDNLRK